jgi:uncharacterized protein (DUF58 family)
VNRFTSPRVAAYAALGAAGLIAALALGRVEPVALAAPFVLAVVAASVFGREPDISASFTTNRERALEGDEVIATVEVASTDGAPRLELLLVLPPELSVEGGAARVIRLVPGETRTLPLTVRCDRWGAFQVGPLLLRSRDILGFRSWEKEIPEAPPLRVYPSEETLQTVVPALQTQVFAGNQVARARGEGIEFADLRTFQPGDRVRRINWRASALRQELWVNEQHPERDIDVVLFLDTFAEARGDGRSTHDRAVRAAAVLAYRYLERRDRVGLIGFGGMLAWLLPEAGSRQLYKIVDTLIESDIVASYALRGVDVLPRRTLPARALVIALTPLLDARTAAALLDLRARGYDLLVVEVSPVEVLGGRPSGAMELPYRLWLLSREALRWRYQQVGVPVVEWSEDTPLAALLEEVKAFRHLARPA